MKADVWYKNNRSDNVWPKFAKSVLNCFTFTNNKNHILMHILESIFHTDLRMVENLTFLKKMMEK